MQTNDLTFSTRNTKKPKKIAISLAAIFLLLCLVVPLLTSCGSNDAETCYQNALKLIEKKEYTKAYELLWSIKDYEKAQAELEKFKFVVTEINNGDSVPTKFTYNQNGQPTRIDYGENTYMEFAYNDAGLLTHEKYFIGGDTNYLFTDDYFTYDENGLLIEKRLGNNVGNVTIYTYEYDEKGNMIKENCCVDHKGNISDCNYSCIECDETGRPISKITYNSDGSFESHYTYAYDEKGREISEIGYNSDGSVWGSAIWAYDENGYRTKYYSEWGSYGGIKYDFVNTYDEKNRLIKHECIDNGEKSYEYTYTYDENGNIIKQHFLFIYDGETRETDTYISYDKYGNAVKCKVGDDDEEPIKYEYTLLYPDEPGREMPESYLKSLTTVILPD